MSGADSAMCLSTRMCAEDRHGIAHRYFALVTATIHRDAITRQDLSNGAKHQRSRAAGGTNDRSLQE